MDADPLVDDSLEADPPVTAAGASGHSEAEEATGVKREDAPPVGSPPGARPLPPEPDLPEEVEVPAFVILCPNCNTAVPFVPGIEGYEPSMGKDFETCPGCDGMGNVKTGSLVPEFAVLPCPDCQSKGFILKDGVTLAEVQPHGTPPWEGAKWNAELGTWT